MTPFQLLLPLLLVPSAFGAGKPPADGRGAAPAKAVLVFVGPWHGEQRSAGGTRGTFEFDARKGRLEGRYVLPDGSVCYGGDRFGGITTDADGSAVLTMHGSTLRGIYRVEGPRVRLCFSHTGRRPAGFGVTDDTFEWLIWPAPAGE
jgi:hypothetical protein